MKNFYLAVIKTPTSSVPPTSNIQILGFDISISTLVTAIIGAVLGAVLAQWLSHIFSTRREDQKYYREVFQELYVEYVYTAVRSYHQLRQDKFINRIGDLEIANNANEQQLMTHLSAKAKYTDAQMIFWVNEYKYLSQNGQSFSSIQKANFYLEFISYMYLTGSKSKSLTSDIKSILLQLLSIAAKEYIALESSKKELLRFRYYLYKWHISRFLFFR